MRISDWSSDVCSSDPFSRPVPLPRREKRLGVRRRSRSPSRERRLSGPGRDGTDSARARRPAPGRCGTADRRSEEHTSELQSLMRISYAVFCLNKTKQITHTAYLRASGTSRVIDQHITKRKITHNK